MDFVKSLESIELKGPIEFSSFRVKDRDIKTFKPIIEQITSILKSSLS